MSSSKDITMVFMSSLKNTIMVILACLCIFPIEVLAIDDNDLAFNLQSCSTFLLKREDTLLVGHNLDQPKIRMQPGMVVVNKRGIEKEARTWLDLTSNKKPGERIRWISRYGSITCNAMGREFPDGGMNEAGLVVCEMTLDGTKYPKSNGKPEMFLVQWIQHLLDTCESVEDVIRKAENITLTGWENAWHFFIADAAGRVAVIEYIDAKLLIYTGDSLPLPVLCNAPYAQELKHIEAYKGFGGRKRISKSDPDPRFLFAAQMLKDDDTSQPATDYAFSILDRLNISCTKWFIVYDIANRSIEFRTAVARDIRTLSMREIDFSYDTPALAIDINSDLKGDIRTKLQPCTDKMNRSFVTKDVERISQMGPWLLQMLSSHGTTKETFIDRLTTYPETTKIPEQIGQETFSTFEEDLKHLIQQNQLPGVAAGIIKDKKLVWAKGIGYADIENKVPADPTTLYRLASTSKPFAAVLIMQLVEQGKLTLETPMANFRVPPRYGKKPIVVSHVMSHTSEWTPGERFDYSGDAYSDLTLVIEETARKSYPDILKENIFDPVGMNRTLPGIYATGYEKTMHDLAIPYEFAGGKLQRSAYPVVVCNWSVSREQQWTIVGFLKTVEDVTRHEILGDSYTPLYGGVNTSGGIVSNIVDLAKFDAALDSNQLISAASRNLMFTPTLSNDKKVLPYGLGWFVQEINKTKLVWHYGHFPPIASSIYLKVPEHNLTFLLLANTSQLSDSFELQEGDVMCSPYAVLFLNNFIFKTEISDN